MPTDKLPKYVEALATLEAQDALDRISQTAAGSGVMDERSQKEYVRSLRRAANGGRAPQAQKATAASLAALGIKVETLPPLQEQKGGDADVRKPRTSRTGNRRRPQGSRRGTGPGGSTGS